MQMLDRSHLALGATVLATSLCSVSLNTFAAGKGVSIEYIAHACFRITAPSGEQLLIDPFASRVWIGYDYPDGIEADAVLITHPHYDHDGGVSVDHLPPWPGTMTVLRDPGTYDFDGVEILGVAGKHADPYGKEFGQTNTIWLLEVAGLRIVHIGDNGPINEETVAQLGDVDILMMPIDSEYHILQEHEIQAVLGQLTPSILIPMHYRLGDLEPDDDEPGDLGDIDGWLKSRNNVRRLGTHQITISAGDLPDSKEIMVFEHSPIMQRPLNDE
jgi:L-ascorbate metabolism protein UlaG (beta-lactamase superfamily)